MAFFPDLGPFIPARYHGQGRMDPWLLVVHYDAMMLSARQVALRFTKKMPRGRRRSAHFSIDRIGEAAQMVDTHTPAWHAGGSRISCVHGVTRRVNYESIGIELGNLGYLSKRPAALQRVAKDHIFEGRHRNPRSTSTLWERYTVPQLETFTEVVRRIKEEHPRLIAVAGHEDIKNYATGSPGSKTDPGPAFPWDEIPWDGLGLRRVRFDFEIDRWRTFSDLVFDDEKVTP